MPNANFKKHLMASSVALAISGAISSATYAQDGTDAAAFDEEVVVTGIRASLQRAMDIKRDSAGVVDAISAEDIGKFPDSNLAESLQRITGIAIDRTRGEGNSITVRGFGGDFNMVTLNGRQMPTHGGNRQFDFGDLASEGVGGVQVYKTGKANVPTGGIGATVNIQTRKPFDNPGFQAVASVKAVHDTSTETGEDWTPEVAAFLSNTFMDDKIGVSLSASFQRRDHGQPSVGVPGGWLESVNAEQLETQINSEILGGTTTDQPAPDDEVSINHPQNFAYNIDEWRRDRTNAQLTVQFQPIESLTATLDYTYSELELDSKHSDMSVWFGNTGAYGNDYSEGPVPFSEVYTETGINPDMSMGGSRTATRNLNESAGINIEWQALDSLSLNLDYHDSTAKSEPTSKYGSGNVISTATFAQRGQPSTIYFDDEFPVAHINLSNPLSPDDVQITGSQFNAAWSEMGIKELNLEGSFEFEELSFIESGSIDFGIANSEVTNFSTGAAQVERGAWGEWEADNLASHTASRPGVIADLLTEVNVTDLFSDFDGVNDPRLTGTFYTFDFEAVAERAEALTRLEPSVWDDAGNLISGDPNYMAPSGDVFGSCGTQFCPILDVPFGNRYIEETDSAYIQVNIQTEVLDRDVNISAGVRHESTDVDSMSASPDYTGIIWTQANEVDIQDAGGDDGVPSSLLGSYDVTLPSIDMDVSLIEDLKLRASYSETIARASYGNLVGTQSVSGTRLRYDPSIDQLGPLTASLGNPGLLPHKSKNIDLSLEWYYGDASYVSAGFFKKKVSEYVTSTTIDDVIIDEDLISPTDGPLVRDALEALPGASVVEVYDWILANRADQPGVDASTGRISGVAGRDGLQVFEVSTQINSDETATVEGWEIAIQHNFFESGFGVIANATFVESDAELDVNDPEQQFVVPGISNTANLIGFYDKDGIMVRISYNWRDEFPTNGATVPAIVAAYSQVDMNASYEISDNFTVFLEGLNITNERFATHSRESKQLFVAGQNKARYNLGARYSF